MIVMPSNVSGQSMGILAARSGRLGHLYSPASERGPWPWFPYALDNGCFNYWDPAANSFDEAAWKKAEARWRRLLFWSQSQRQRALWAIAPDRPGDWDATANKWREYAPEIAASGIPLAVAVQNGATPAVVRGLFPRPFVICVGGDTKWKWETAEMWLREFPRVHVLRVNAIEKVEWLETRKCDSCDGSGWPLGGKFRKLEEWAMRSPAPNLAPIWPTISRVARGDKNQEAFA